MASPIEEYIRRAAIARGINPDIAVQVAKHEGGLNDPTRRAGYVKNGFQEPSYGPFQLLIGGDGTGFPQGLGNRAVQAGIDPRQPDQWQKGVDFALDEVKRDGWRQWYGAKAGGVDRWEGVNGPGTVMGGAGPDPMAKPSMAQPPPNLSGIGSPNMYPPADQDQDGQKRPPSLVDMAAQSLGLPNLGMSQEEAAQIAAYRDGLGQKKSLGSRLGHLGKSLAAIESPQAISPGGVQGPSQAQIMALTEALKARGSLAEHYNRKRRGL